ncbi:hypothetical protein K431DRAFT_286190 [Polychaeton citri CBS 116435]|uniref:Uncharacterized protein n=1 Tax=Polychaeton citri CBS 116435 TaxID=1314669 RepID=A0A9P4Q5P0_9PEZI|nr:hypothetical protein K431DRAFT_286190 [Polychaeton citri CBS 116435]
MAASTARPVIRALLNSKGSLGHQRRAISTSPILRASILFALSALSNSRETQHFNKLTRLSRVEHSPPLKLIKTSEIDPYPLPELPRKGPTTILPTAWIKRRQRNDRAKGWDEQALKAGRAILLANAHRETRLKLALRRAQRRADGEQRLSVLEREQWGREHRRLRNELRAAGLWILASIGTATALATWRFWPDSKRSELNDGEFARRLASRARAALPLPAAMSAGQKYNSPQELEQQVSNITDVAPAVPLIANAEAGILGPGAAPTQTANSETNKADEQPKSSAAPEIMTASWWRGWFWKHE